MRKFAGTILTSLILSSPLYAGNRCVDDIDHHYYQAFNQLFLYNCHITDRDMAKVREFIDAKQDVFMVTLDNNNIGPEGAKELAKLTSTTPMVITLDNNHVGDDGAQALAANTNFYALLLYNNYITAKGAKALAASTNLVYLGIASNKIEESGALALAKSKSLQILDVEDANISAAGIIALANNPNINGLLIKDNEMDDVAMNAILANTNYEYLSFSYKYIRSSQIKTLATTMPKLRYLRISDSNLDNEAAKTLATSNAKLSVLDLSHNKFSGEGLTALTQQFNELYYIDVSDNTIGDDGTTDFAAKYNGFAAIMDNVGMHDQGAIALAKNQSLQLLYVLHNDISDTGYAALKANEKLFSVVYDYEDDNWSNKTAGNNDKSPRGICPKSMHPAMCAVINKR